MSLTKEANKAFLFQHSPAAFQMHLKTIFVPQSVPVLDVCVLLSNSVKRRRTILTVPWLVEFLSMLDYVGPLLLCYRTALGTLLLLYRSVFITGDKIMSKSGQPL